MYTSILVRPINLLIWIPVGQALSEGSIYNPLMFVSFCWLRLNDIPFPSTQYYVVWRSMLGLKGC